MCLLFYFSLQGVFATLGYLIVPPALPKRIPSGKLHVMLHKHQTPHSNQHKWTEVKNLGSIIQDICFVLRFYVHFYRGTLYSN